jgi:hypothetical protein
MTEFQEFQKIPRLNRDCAVTEKLDGTNGTIYVGDDGEFLVGSRNRWITPENDNMGFARWAYENREALVAILGPGWHRGEWWGQGIQRRYGLTRKVFSLFNTEKWADLACNPIDEPDRLLYRVPVLYEGPFSTEKINGCLKELQERGSHACPFMDPEGVVVYHHAAKQYFKATIKGDESPKSQQ